MILQQRQRPVYKMSTYYLLMNVFILYPSRKHNIVFSPRVRNLVAGSFCELLVGHYLHDGHIIFTGLVYTTVWLPAKLG